jgi:serine palmitoyltransferase
MRALAAPENPVCHACHAHSGFEPLNFTGTAKRCLNLGSYNYLGFAAADEYCTPRVQVTLRDLGVSTCSARSDIGRPRG